MLSLAVRLASAAGPAAQVRNLLELGRKGLDGARGGGEQLAHWASRAHHPPGGGVFAPRPGDA